MLIKPHNIKLLTRQMGAGSSAWLERSTDNRKVGSSNPPRPTIHPLIFAFLLWLRSAYHIILFWFKEICYVIYCFVSNMKDGPL